MVHCPHCGKGMIWGVYLDIPPEMKTGQAEWVSCDVPASQDIVTCPSCNQEAGVYSDLYAENADYRREEKRRQLANHQARTEIIQYPAISLLVYTETGNFNRPAFVHEVWQKFSEWLQILSSDRVLPRDASTLAEDCPKAFGIRFGDSVSASTKDLKYGVAVPIPDDKKQKLQERIDHPEYNDIRHTEILEIPEGMFSCYDFNGSVEDFLEAPKFLLKHWSENHDSYQPQENSFLLEAYPERLGSWPPLQSANAALDKNFTLKFLLPLEPAAAIENEAKPESESDSEPVVSSET